ncbi:hypothetical protein MUO74_10615 [Candidatus Bathyarchaeota archaeon]|nr:hypothetical protein [Candidatus Bathyarchaeota archaeon]
MTDWIRKALTKTVQRKGSRGREQIVVVQPNEKLVYAVKFAIGMTVCLSALEIAHMAFLGTWSSEVFAGITGLIGTVSGVLIGQHA